MISFEYHNVKSGIRIYFNPVPEAVFLDHLIRKSAVRKGNPEKILYLRFIEGHRQAELLSRKIMQNQLYLFYRTCVKQTEHLLLKISCQS